MDMIPTGFRFCPSDKVLLSYYLLKKLKGEPTQFQIPDVDVYGIEPWSLFNDINDDDDDEEDDDDDTYNNLAYVFTTIQKKNGNNESNRKKKHGSESEKISRTVTTPSSKNQVIGTWRDQKAQDIIDMVSKKIIGSKRMLSFIPKQDHDDEDNEGTSNKRKRNHRHLDGISYIMHEYSMAGSPHALCRIRRKISKSRKMNNKKMKYSSSSCSKNITRKNTCWDDQGTEYDDEPLHGSRMPYEDDHHQMMTTTSVLLNHNQSSMLQQQQQQDQGAEYNQQVQECMPQMMMNASVLDHDQNSMWQQQQQPEHDTEFNYQHIQLEHDPDQSSMSQVMMDTSIVDPDQSSIWQQQQPDQDVEHDQLLQGRIPYDDHHQIMVDSAVLDDHDQSSMWQQQQPDQDQLLQGRMTFSEMMNAPLVLDENYESSMRQQPGVTSGSPILTNDDKTTGTGHEEVVEEDLGNDQQKQPPAPTSEREDNLYLLSSIDFQSDDSYSDFGNFNFSEPPLDTISLWSY